MADYLNIDKIEQVYPDVDLIHLDDGKCIGISTDCICIYENEEAFYKFDEDFITLVIDR